MKTDFGEKLLHIGSVDYSEEVYKVLKGTKERTLAARKQ